jgi:hypothetical protein
MPLEGGYYSCLKNREPYSFFWQDWYGVGLAYLLDDEVGLLEGTTGVRVSASDGWSVDLTLDRVRDPNSQGLYTILAWQAGEKDAPHADPPHPEIGLDDGPFRLALGQDPTVGEWPEGTPNYHMFLKNVRTVEVQPLPAGVLPVDPTTVPEDQIVVYGNIVPSTAPTVTGITPSQGANIGAVAITDLAGTGFQDGATVKLEKSGSPTIDGTDVVVVSDTQITCMFNIQGADLGAYDVVVVNPDLQEGRLAGGFTVTDLCGQGGGSMMVGFSLATGLLALAGIGYRRRLFSRK